MVVLSNEEFWKLTDEYEKLKRRKKFEGADMIIDAYKRHRSHNIDGAIADYQLLTNMEPTSYIVNRIKRKLGVKK